MKKIFILTTSLFLAITTMQAQDRSQPKPGAAPTVNVEKPKSFTLKNGLKVLIVENHKLPRVTYSLTLDAPLYLEGQKAGVSTLASAIMGAGTDKMSKDQFNEEVDFLGADFRFWDKGAYASGLSKYSETLLSLMADGALHSKFTKEEFEKEKAKAIEGIKSSEKSVTAVAARVENALVYGVNHPAGEFVTEETLNKVTFEDVQKHYADFFVPENAYLVIVGDVDYKKTEKLVTKLFGNWKKASAPKSNVGKPQNLPQAAINFIDMGNAVQSEIALVNLVDLKITDKDFFAAILANQILGGGGEGRLFLNLREAHGWTYGAYSSIGNARKFPAKFKATSSVRNVVTDSAVTEFFNEVEKIRKELVSAEDLKNAKAKYIGKFVMDIQKPETIARYALNTELDKLPADFYENYIKDINAVTVEDVRKAAQKYFLAEQLRVVIVGKAADVLPGLEKLGMPIAYFDKFGNPTTKPEVNKPLPAGVTVNTVVDSYIKAIGGEKAVKAVRTVLMKSAGTVQGMPLESLTKVTDKGQMLSEQSMMGNVMSKQVVTPKTGYMVQQGQKADLTGEDLEEARRGAYPFAELTLKNKANVTLTGIEMINGKEAYAVKEGKETNFYDVATGLKVATFTTVEQGGQTGVQEVYYSDYKEVKGVKFPYTIKMNVGIEIELKVSEIKINEGVTDADFK
ncbi:pitrilysin family protein [Flavobacterium sp. HSC-61S13]|uniref:M16 family metallopeptidase n=1 Tax=Flavobacterium sp. HSC-61S13 TaxID=2910963 RepID=UPI00209E6D0A|nr:pitrilysin family protein [Flavobacterium sp. HSC-61S13]MCP1997025.1 putative Zn-dependent peptidase [Flavobacterium sp. HSC-61S13]